MMHSTTICSAAAWLICGTLACSSDRHPAKSSNDAPAIVASGDSAETARNDRETTIRLSEEIMRECRFPTATEELPRFELDQATLRGPAKNSLDDVANCLTQGPLQNRTIT